ncbi:PucR family transcriptional regulator [Nocardia sp. CA-151230]|uniref:PucR family transcriptional regulator n=1 Tax=Nocardia sp. CA-151230 TaxID=3239982 RepID=UPI003D913F27
MTRDTQADWPRLLGELRGDVAVISDRVTARIEHEERDYGDAALTHDELATLVADNIAELLDAIADKRYSLEPAHRTGRLKAERGLPLDGLLHAFRIAGMAVWEVIIDRVDHPMLPQLSTRVWATVDEYSIAAADAYRRTVVSGDQRPNQLLLRALLDPDLPAAQRETLRSRMRLPAGATLAVLVGDVRLAAAGVTTVETLLADDRVTLAVAASPRALDHAFRAATSQRAGASRPFTDLVYAPTALDQARLALLCLTPSETGIHTYASAPVRALLAADPSLTADVLSDVLAALDPLHPDDSNALVETALAWYELGGSTSAVGKRLHLHRNTVLHRLKRIERLTGKAFAVPADAALLYLALQASLLHPASGPET